MILAVFVSGRRLVVDDVVDGMTWIWSDVGGVWNSYDQVWVAVIGGVGSVELWSAAWKWLPSVAVVEWSDQ